MAQSPEATHYDNEIILDLDQNPDQLSQEELVRLAPQTVEAATKLVESILNGNKTEIEFSTDPAQLMGQLLEVRKTLRLTGYKLNKLRTTLDLIWNSKERNEISLDAELAKKISKLINVSLYNATVLVEQALDSSETKIDELAKTNTEAAQIAEKYSSRTIVESIFTGEDKRKEKEKNQPTLQRIIYDLVKTLPIEAALKIIATFLLAILFILNSSGDTEASNIEGDIEDTLELINNGTITTETIGELIQTTSKLAELIEKDFGSLASITTALNNLEIDHTSNTSNGGPLEKGNDFRDANGGGNIESDNGEENPTAPELTVEITHLSTGYSININNGENRIIISDEMIGTLLSTRLDTTIHGENVELSYNEDTQSIEFSLDGQLLAATPAVRIQELAEGRLLNVSESNIYNLIAVTEVASREVEVVATATVNGGSPVNIRNMSGEQIGESPRANTTFNIIATHPDLVITVDGDTHTGWVEVALENGTTGYIWTRANIDINQLEVPIIVSLTPEAIAVPTPEITSTSIFADFEPGLYPASEFVGIIDPYLLNITVDGRPMQVIVADSENMEVIFDPSSGNSFVAITIDNETINIAQFSGVISDTRLVRENGDGTLINIEEGLESFGDIENLIEEYGRLVFVTTPRDPSKPHWAWMTSSVIMPVSAAESGDIALNGN